jgi:hypothetical protein
MHLTHVLGVSRTLCTLFSWLSAVLSTGVIVQPRIKLTFRALRVIVFLGHIVPDIVPRRH